jgi:hypothetical protein
MRNEHSPYVIKKIKKPFIFNTLPPKMVKKPFIFNKKINDKYNIISFNFIKNTLGPVKHSPAATKEWYNSIYSYNYNSIKSLTIVDKNLSKIIKSYFNLYLNNEFLNSNYSTITTRFKRLATNKVFISKAELKHTSSKVSITLYVYNQERIDILKKIKIIEKLLFPLYKSRKTKTKENSSLSFNEKLNILKSNEDNVSINNVQTKIELLVLNLIESQLSILSIVKSLEAEIADNFIIDVEDYNLKLKDLVYYIITFVTNSVNKKTLKKNKTHLEKEIFIIAYYKLLLNLNKFKFEDKFLLKLKPLINKLYNKEVEFNIINLKALYLNSDILTEIIALKLKNRNNRLLRVLKSSLSLIKLRINKVSDNYHRLEIRKLWNNKVKNLNLNPIINKYSLLFNNTNKDVFNKILSHIFLNSSFITKNVNNKLDVEESNNIFTYVFNQLKHKKMAGVRLEAKGRLTRRFTASRSVFKMKWKGTLKNIDTTYRGLSSVILRGNIKSNVQYSIINSKTRNGAFGIRGWISGK